MPELVAIGSIGALITFLLANFNLFIVHKSFSDPKIEILNANLAKMEWYWSMEQGAAVSVEGQDIQSVRDADYQKATRSAFIFGTLMIFLSWLGLLILSIYMISVHKTAKSRIEKKIMSSDLANRNISDAEMIKQLLSQATGVG
ncbi:MAG: hypothetical protein JNL11_04900 [Bdellovibrionaceae bacterium]|nr:hypothetical protein [Pseudobdellovibrionaceae bacterium]